MERKVSPPHSHNLSQPPNFPLGDEQQQQQQQHQHFPDDIEERNSIEERERMSIDDREVGERGELVGDEEGNGGGGGGGGGGDGGDYGREKYRSKMSHWRMILMSGYWFARYAFLFCLFVCFFSFLIQ